MVGAFRLIKVSNREIDILKKQLSLISFSPHFNERQIQQKNLVMMILKIALQICYAK